MVTKSQVYVEYAGVGQVLSSGVRLELLELLFQSERSVDQLANLTALSVANVSRHLQVLRRSRLVDVRRTGAFAYYRISSPQVFKIWEAIRLFREENVPGVKEVLREFLKGREELEEITAEELHDRLADRKVVILDVRPSEEFAAGHIAGAISVPLRELAGRLREFPGRKEIVAYCRGPYFVLSDVAVELLTRHGFKVKRLEVGMPKWRERGLPGETACTLK